MKQALLSFGDDFAVKDETGRDQYYFDGKAFSFGKHLVIKNSNGNEVARLKQKLLTFAPTYRLVTDKGELARISKKLLTFRPSFLIDVPGPDDITVVGKMIEHDYRFLRNGSEIAHCSKRWFRAKDTYGIDVHDQSDALLVLSAAVVIDLVCHPKRDSSF